MKTREMQALRQQLADAVDRFNTGRADGAAVGMVLVLAAEVTDAKERAHVCFASNLEKETQRELLRQALLRVGAQ